jgi:putative membrane protein
MKFLLKLVVSTLAIIVVSSFMKDKITFQSPFDYIIVAAVLSFLNAVLKPILVFFTIPLTIFSLGFFLLIINASMILLTEHFVKGFKVEGFLTALIFSILLSIVTSILEFIAKTKSSNDD